MIVILFDWQPLKLRCISELNVHITVHR